MRPIVTANTLSHHTITQAGGPLHVHHHDFHELYYMVKGNTTYYIGDQMYYVESGTFVFIPQGVSHKTYYKNSSPNERILLHLDDSIFIDQLSTIKEELCNSRVIHIANSKVSYFRDLLKKIEDEFQSSNNYSDTIKFIHIMELLAQICRHKYDYTPILSGSDQTIYFISKYISTHYQEPLTLNDLSKVFSLNKSYLSRKFKEKVELGINEYITYVRIANAEKMLKETDLSITEIAQQCGFSDSNYFSTVFKKIKGTTPMKYRK